MRYAFINSDFTRYHKFCLDNLEIHRKLEVINGHPIKLDDIIHTICTKLSINSPEEDISIFVTKRGYCPVLLGIPWLQRHDPTIS
jgi:hypothetical protein